jgi:hypothetical protein
MMYCTTSTTWSRPVLSLYCIEPGPFHGPIPLGCITTVSMSMSGQLGRRCTV